MPPAIKKRIASVFLSQVPLSQSQTPGQRPSKWKNNNLFWKEQLLSWTSQFSPLFALDLPPADLETPITNLNVSLYCGINLDISGCEKLFKGENNLICRLHSGLCAQGFMPRIACAPTLGSAWALSRYGGEEISQVEQGNLKEKLSPLPLAALRLCPKLESLLQELNFTHIAQLLKIPRKSLLCRFEQTLLRHLDWALGKEEEVFSPLHREQPIKEQIIFDGAQSQFDSIIAAGRILLRNVVEQLLASGRKACCLVLKINSLNAAPQLKTINLSLPTDDQKHLWKLLKSRLEQCHMGLGVESLMLSVTHFEHVRAEQLAHQSICQKGEVSSGSREYGALMDILSEHLGAQGLLQLESLPSHIPEKSFQYQPLQHHFPSLNSYALMPERKTFNVALDTERPSLLYYYPHPIQALALMPDYPPCWIKWKSKAYRITNALGPERIAPQWWGKDDSICATRDYFKVQLPTGLWLWIFRELESSKWFVHGVWG